jgi:hypothetical protein
MSIVALGLAEEFRNAGIACNGLWPATTIATAAVRHAFGGESALQRARKPAIVADAAYEVLCSDARRMTGRFLLDEDVLRNAGVQDFDAYQYAPGGLYPGLVVASGGGVGDRLSRCRTSSATASPSGLGVRSLITCDNVQRGGILSSR